MGIENERSSTLSIESIPSLAMDQQSHADTPISDVHEVQITDNHQPIKDSEKCVKLPEEQEKMLKANDDDDDDEYEMVPPDGGYSYLVLLGAMMVNILIPGGAIKSFGILFVEFIEDMNASPSAASWIPALCYFLYSSLGPLSSILSVKYSYRTVTFVGAVFCSLGMIMTHWANSIEFLYISYGVFVGIGAGLSFPPTVYIVTSYFTKKRGLANGLCISGSALGSIFLPPILRVLLDQYGYRGACLIMGAGVMNCFIAALFYDPVEKHLIRVKVERNIDNNEQDDFNTRLAHDLRNEKILEEEESAESINENGNRKAKFILTHADDYTNSPAETPTMEHKLDIFRFSIPKNSFERSASAVVVPSVGSERHRKISQPLKSDYRNGTALSFVGQLSSTPSLVEQNSSNMRLNRFNSNRLSSTRRTLKASPSTSSFQFVTTPFQGTLSSLQPNEFSSHMSLKSIASSLNPVACKRPADAIMEDSEPTGINKYFDLSLLRDPAYLIILISNSTNAISYTNFIILLPAYAMALGFDKDRAAYLLSIVSTFDLIGRIGGSALSDLNLIPKTWFFVGGLTVSGIGLTFLPMATSYLWVSVLCSIFGLATGCYVGITAICMADMLGTDRLTSSYGISLFVNGILQLLGPPICLNIYEVINEYQSIFFVLGLFLLLGSSLWLLMPWVQKRKLAAQEELRQQQITLA